MTTRIEDLANVKTEGINTNCIKFWHVEDLRFVKIRTQRTWHKGDCIGCGKSGFFRLLDIREESEGSYMGFVMNL